MNRIFRGSLAASAVALLWGATLPADAQGQQALVIQGGTLIDGNGGAPVANSVVVMQGDRITAVGRAGQVQVPAGAHVINARGKWVLPGLIDAKGNYNWHYGEAYLHYGVTSVMVSGGRSDEGLAERDAINHGIYPGPRLYQAVVTLNGPGPDLKKRQTYQPGEGNHVVYTGKQAVAQVDMLHNVGADIITFQNGDGPPDVFAPAVAEAQRLGMGIDFRSMGPQTRAREVAQMGTGIVLVHTGNAGTQMAKDPAKWKDYIGLPPDAYADIDPTKEAAMIKLLVSKKMLLEPDLMATGRGFHKNWARVQQESRDFYKDPVLRQYYPNYAIRAVWENQKAPETYMKPDALKQRALGFKNHVAFLKKFVDAGGRLVAASDSPQTVPGLGVHQEIDSMVEDVGLTPMQAIEAGTSWTADGFREADIGRIATGKYGDVIIVDANPLQNILNLRKISTVIKGGKVIDNAYHADYRDRAGIFANSFLEDYDVNLSGEGWAASLKKATWRPKAENGGFNRAGGFDSELSPTPGIEAFMPYAVHRGAGDTTVKITGFNFVRGSKAMVDGHEVPTKVASRTELEATIPATMFAKAGKLHIVVQNPEPLANPEWGDHSNTANLIVPFEFTKILPQPEW